MDNKKTLRNLLIYLGIPIVLIIIIASIFMNRGHSTIKTSEVVSYFAEQRVREYNLDFGSGAMVIKLDDGTEQKYTCLLYTSRCV